jgi:hypothetical protein
VKAGTFHVGAGFGCLGVAGGSCDFLVYKIPRRARSAGEAVKMKQRWQMDSSDFKRSREGDRQTAQLGRSDFSLTREDKVFEELAAMLLG